VTGLIKANLPSRIAFQVSSKIDSRTILDQMGAESLLGHGDMLYMAPGTGVPVRIHGAFVADHEVHKVVEHLKTLAKPEYLTDITEPAVEEGADVIGGHGEAQAFSGACDLQRGDADDDARPIEQRPAAVAGIDGGVGLQQGNRA